MPIISVNTSRPLSDAQMGALSDGLSNITESVLRKNRNVIVVRFTSGDHSGCWYNKGRVSNDALIFDLSIIVTKGTNTGLEKSEWIALAWRIMTDALGGSEHPNYISVNEIDGDDWGYNGLTQNGRKKSAA